MCYIKGCDPLEGVYTNVVLMIKVIGMKALGPEGIAMKRKAYQKPELRSRKIQLGVFGNYSGTGGDGTGDKDEPIPVDIIRNLDLHME
jgi:hypothetical protein